MNENEFSNYESDTETDQIPFIDYEGMGLWIFGIHHGASVKPEFETSEIVDRDSDLNKLVGRAVRDWGVDPRELWVSPCAREIAVLALTGMKI